jgi:parallel beta-helix repeat protein
MFRICYLLVVLLAWTGSPLVVEGADPASPAFGRTLYVRQTVGDDANDGLSPETAWQSLSRLGKALQTGDTAYVGPGLYREQLTVKSSGTAEARITLVADTSGEHTGDPPGTVMITGADPVDEAIFVPGPSPGVYTAPSPEGRVWGAVEMDGPQHRYTRAWDTQEHLKEDLPELDVVAKLPSTLHYDLETKILALHTSDGKPPSTHEIELIRRTYGIVTYDKHYVTVVGFTFRHMGTAGINFGKGSSHCAAIGNVSYGAWQGLRASDATDVLFQGNTLFRNGNSGIYFLSAAGRGFAIGNVAYDNAKGLRWSSQSGDGLAIGNTVFDNREVGIAIEEADDIRSSGNVLANNKIAQLLVRKARFTSEGNCFERGGPDQLTAQTAYAERYETLADYQEAAGQDLASREGCGPLPETINVHELHAETSSYLERARKTLADVGEMPGL